MPLPRDPTPPSMSQLARVAGVHQSTVSRALRRDRSIPAATRQRIQALADKLGYRPHPLVSALVALRRRRLQHPEYFEKTDPRTNFHPLPNPLRRSDHRLPESLYSTNRRRLLRLQHR